MAEAVPEIGVLVLELSGEIDVDTAPAARDEGLEALQLPWLTHLVVDLAAVEFMGSAGLGALLDLRTSAADAGIEFSLARVPSRVHRILELSGLTSSFTIDSAEPA